jgi:hypothetical protein
MRRIRVEVIFSENQKLQKWQMADLEDYPSVWTPFYRTPKRFGDLHLLGLEITTDSKGEILEIGCIVDLSDMNKKYIKWPSSEEVQQGKVFLKGISLNTPSFYEYKNQNLYYDPINSIVEWVFSLHESEKFVQIAENVIIGLRGATLQSILIKLK